MRKEPVLKNTVIVAQIGWGEKEHKARTLAAGFDYHLVKPINIEALKDILSLLDEEKVKQLVS